MKILRAEHAGMCFGVRDAIALALAKAQSESITIFGELVHNESVLAMLASRGIRMENQVDAIPTKTVMISAHGASQTAMDGIKTRGLSVLEATCPLVRLAHKAVADLARAGCHPVIIGKRDHTEVRGLIEDLAEYSVILGEEDVARLPEKPKYGVAAQTTQPIERVRHLVWLIRQRFPEAEVRFIDTVCLPTKQRQAAAIELAQQTDVVVVIGGKNSNNTRELAATCSRYCTRVYPVQSAGDLRPEWFAEARTVGITAGTSTPDKLIQDVEDWLHELAARLEYARSEPAHASCPG